MARRRMPVLFIGHGSPMYVIEDNPYGHAWREVADRFPRPVAVLCVSAHWETDGTAVTAEENPKTIHDFYGFPRALYQITFPAPGDPGLARRIGSLVRSVPVQERTDWGLDHGAWSVLIRMYPEADVPVLQLSLDRRLTPRQHLLIGRELRPLRDEGVLVLGSGNIVHNLGLLGPSNDGAVGHAYLWARQFDEGISAAIAAGDAERVADYTGFGDAARLAVPTPEHFLPLLYVLGARDDGEAAEFFAEGYELGALSMRSVAFGLL